MNAKGCGILVICSRTSWLSTLFEYDLFIHHKDKRGVYTNATFCNIIRFLRSSCYFPHIRNWLSNVCFLYFCPTKVAEEFSSHPFTSRYCIYFFPVRFTLIKTGLSRIRPRLDPVHVRAGWPTCADDCGARHAPQRNLVTVNAILLPYHFAGMCHPLSA